MNNPDPLDLQTAMELAAKNEKELDRKVFFLKTLFETSRELSSVVQPKRILETFLLMAMGPVGITEGFAALLNTKTGQGFVSARGISGTDVDALMNRLPIISSGEYFLKEAAEGALPRLKFLAADNASESSLFPRDIRVIVFWSLSDEYSGLFGLGEKISKQPFDDGDSDLLLNLTNILTSALSRALSIIGTQQLNAELLRSNTELTEALEKAKRSRNELDRRIFHLKSLSDLNTELSPLIDVEALLRAFILVVMGSLGASCGWVVVYDRETRVPKFASRGLEREPELSGEACEKLLFRAFNASKNKSLSPMTVSPLEEPGSFGESGIELEAALGVFFLLDSSCMGMILVGPAFTEGLYSPEDEDLLVTQTSSFLVFLKNARAFVTIQSLNRELVARNEALLQTIRELTEAEQTISLLEKARGRMLSLIQRERERIGRARALDFALILLLAFSIGILFNFANPQGVPLIQESALRAPAASIDPGEARRMIEEERAVLVDARPKELFDQKHIKGAANVPLALFDVMHMMKLNNLDPEIPVIVYGRNISRLYDEELAFRLRQRDHDRVVVLSGGLDAWEAQGYPVQ